MQKVLIVYGTTEGHTRTIAEFVADVVHRTGGTAEIHEAGDLEVVRWTRFDGCLVAASVHQGRHQENVTSFVRGHHEVLSDLPSAFLSVSLSAAIDAPEHRDEAEGYLAAFLQETGWRPRASACVAGAIRHAEYDYWKRLVLKVLARQLGPGVLAGTDIVYTDWEALGAFLETFLGGPSG